MTPHEEKYEAMARKIGIERLLSLIPFPVKTIDDMLSAGDEHLNSWGMSAWQRRHLAIRELAFRHGQYSQWCLAYSVCVLKHVAIHHFATKNLQVNSADETDEGEGEDD